MEPHTRSLLNAFVAGVSLPSGIITAIAACLGANLGAHTSISLFLMFTTVFCGAACARAGFSHLVQILKAGETQ